MIGQTFSRWTVIKDAHKVEGKPGLFVGVLCSCGTVRVVQKFQLTSGKTKSCGCLRIDNISGVIRDVLPVGSRFGRLVVTNVGFVLNEKAMYPVVCDCGNTKVVRKHNLVNGATKSCGCLSAELSSERKPSITHGLSWTPEYQVWNAAIQRCSRENNVAYSNYGGRGIKVCDRWVESGESGFLNFLEDMGERPEGLTLDRIDVNGNYCKENCRWVDSTIQNHNRRKRENCSSIYIGVCYDNTFSKWQAYIQKYGKRTTLGYFLSEESAARAYDEACFINYGVRKNFPETQTE